MRPTAITVSELNKYIKNKVDEDEYLNNVYIKGEISNFKHHYTGHMYFTLKDENSLIKCIMFKSSTATLNFVPKDGMKVNVLGSVAVFERDGVYQIYAKAMQEDGVGDLYAKFNELKNKLEKEPYIKKATVKKHFLTEVNIEIEENSPLFYYVPNKKTVLEDGKETDSNFPVPTLVNYVPNKIYDNFLEEMANTDYSIIKRMSEIKYDPNDVDDERFLITMNDGNYVYLTLSRFNKINHYIEIIKEFNNKKGILYLDSGEYFKVME